MHAVEKRLREIRQAISNLREAAAMDGDAQRAGVAQSLGELFGQVSTREELREAAAQAMRHYQGGMGSFQDAGTPAMGDAVDGLRRALAKARLRLPAG